MEAIIGSSIPELNTAVSTQRQTAWIAAETEWLSTSQRYSVDKNMRRQKISYWIAQRVYNKKATALLTERFIHLISVLINTSK